MEGQGDPRVGGALGLLERQGELAKIDRAVEAVRAGQGGRVLLVTGPPGIGKTSLLRETGDRAVAGGMRVLEARGGPLERDLPHAIVRRLLERAARDGGGEIYRGFAGLARPLFEPLGSDGRRSDLPERDELCHAIYWLLINLAADGPLALLIDDAHDGDEASLAALTYVASRIEPLDLLLVVASRPVSPPGPALAALAGVAGPDGRLEPV
jgi:predicted ATPase